MAKKPVYKKLVERNQTQARRYTKQVEASMRTLAKELVRELKAKVKTIAPMHMVTDSRRAYVNVEFHQPIDPIRVQEIRNDLHSYDRFVSLDLGENEKSLRITQYIVQPFAFRPGAH